MEITEHRTKETMGLDEAAAYLRLGRDATRALWDAGTLPGVSLNQKHLVFRRAALDRFLAEQEVIQQRERRRAAVACTAPRDRGRRSLPDLDRYDASPQPRGQV